MRVRAVAVVRIFAGEARGEFDKMRFARAGGAEFGESSRQAAVLLRYGTHAFEKRRAGAGGHVREIEEVLEKVGDAVERATGSRKFVGQCALRLDPGDGSTAEAIRQLREACVHFARGVRRGHGLPGRERQSGWRSGRVSVHGDSSMDAAPPIVKFSSLQKRYGEGPVVLDHLDLTVAAGDFVSLIGPSGCGKSTILKLASGLSPGTSGTVEVLGTKPKLARDRQAFIFQDATLLPWLTAQRNAELPLRLRRVDRVARAAKAAEMLSLVGLEQYRDYYPRQLSGGMKMRVSIARALTSSPELLLLDEPFGALDEMTRNRLNEELLTLRERSRFTALFVTHSVSEAVFLSNRILVMAAHPGRFHAEIAVDFPYPRPPELRQDPRFQAKVNQVSQALHQVEVAP